MLPLLPKSCAVLLCITLLLATPSCEIIRIVVACPALPGNGPPDCCFLYLSRADRLLHACNTVPKYPSDKH